MSRFRFRCQSHIEIVQDFSTIELRLVEILMDIIQIPVMVTNETFHLARIRRKKLFSEVVVPLQVKRTVV